MERENITPSCILCIKPRRHLDCAFVAHQDKCVLLESGDGCLLSQQGFPCFCYLQWCPGTQQHSANGLRDACFRISRPYQGQDESKTVLKSLLWGGIHIDINYSELLQQFNYNFWYPFLPTGVPSCGSQHRPRFQRCALRQLGHNCLGESCQGLLSWGTIHT